VWYFERINIPGVIVAIAVACPPPPLPSQLPSLSLY
jgi:hypothetical protein